MKSALFAFALIVVAGVSAHATPAASRIKVVADNSFSGKMSTGKILNLQIQADGSIQKSLSPTNMIQTLTIKSVEDARMGDGDLVITFDSGEKLEQSSRGITGTGDTGVYFIDSSGEQVNLIPAVTIQAR